VVGCSFSTTQEPSAGFLAFRRKIFLSIRRALGLGLFSRNYSFLAAKAFASLN
jgi:hypothetical protein